MALTGCGYLGKFKINAPRLHAEYFASCAEIKSTVANIQANLTRLPKSPIEIEDGATNSTKPTPLQSEGIDEADWLKVGDNKIAYVRRNHIVILDRRTHSEIEKIATTPESATSLYITGNTLIVIEDMSYQKMSKIVSVRYFSIAGSKAKLIKEEKWPGSLLASRRTNDKLHLILQDSPQWIDRITSAAEGQKNSEARCKQTLKPVIEDGDFTLLSIVVASIGSTHQEPQSIHMMGQAYEIFMGSQNIYIAKKDRYTDLSEDGYLQWGRESTIISKIHIDLASGSLSARGSGRVGGSLKDSFAMNELKEEFVAVATSQAAYKANLSILKDKGTHLEVIASLEDLSPNEDVSTTRFVGELAYVITFKQTDPVLSISLTDPAHPKIEGHLSVPGLSKYLYPVGEGQLAGVGFDTNDLGIYQGTQVSLFDVADPANPSRTSNFDFGGRGSYSHATQDHHAFFFDSETGAVAIPTMEFNAVPADSWETGTDRTTSGARFFQIKNKFLQATQTVSHWDMVPDACKEKAPFPRGSSAKFLKTPNVDIHRIFKLDGRFHTISPFGMKSWSLTAQGELQPEEVIRFSLSDDGREDCPNYFRNLYNHWWTMPDMD